MGSTRYWIAIGVLAAFVGLVVFVSTSPVQDQAAVSSPTSTALTDPASTTTTTTQPATTTTQPEATTTTMQPAATTTLPRLPMTDGGPDWLWAYYPMPEVLSGQVVDVDDDGEPDIALFGSAESPMIYPIDDGGDPIEPVASAQELVAASKRIAELESDISALEQIAQELTEQLTTGENAPVARSATPTGTSQALEGAEPSTATPKDPEDDIESSGLTSAQQSLLLALISTAGIVLAGLGAPVMTAWARQRFGGASE